VLARRQHSSPFMRRRGLSGSVGPDALPPVAPHFPPHDRLAERLAQDRCGGGARGGVLVQLLRGWLMLLPDVYNFSQKCSVLLVMLGLGFRVCLHPMGPELGGNQCLFASGSGGLLAIWPYVKAECRSTLHTVLDGLPGGRRA
jgi:hypothetical protein